MSANTFFCVYFLSILFFFSFLSVTLIFLNREIFSQLDTLFFLPFNVLLIQTTGISSFIFLFVMPWNEYHSTTMIHLIFSAYFEVFFIQNFVKVFNTEFRIRNETKWKLRAGWASSEPSPHLSNQWSSDKISSLEFVISESLSMSTLMLKTSAVFFHSLQWNGMSLIASS